MIPPRRADQASAPALVTGLLGAAAALRTVRAIVAELAEDGDRSEPGAAPPERGAGELVEVVLGLAALANAAAGRLSQDGSEPANDGDGAALGTINLVIKELLR